MFFQFKIFVSSCVSRIFETVLSLFVNTVVINGYFSRSIFSFNRHNLGDDINVPLLESITGKRVTLLRCLLFNNNKEHLLCIGSIVEDHSNENSIIWGSGAMFGTEPMKNKPKKICAVRGEYTRNYLIQNGICCPNVYGDPALLLPLIYDKNLQKKYRIGVIPHIIDFNLDIVKRVIVENPSIHVIRFNDYSSWHDVIDEIRMCDCIISSSLHGLIISDAYGVPNVRVIFSDSIKGGDFKYKDYYSGVNRVYSDPLDWRYSYNLQDALDSISLYKPISFNPVPLLRTFPYKLSDTFVNSLKTRGINI